MSKVVGFVFVIAGVGLAASLLSKGSEVEFASLDFVKGAPTDSLNVATVGPAEPAANARPAAPVKVERPARQNASAPVVVTITHRSEPAPAAPHKAARVPPDRVSLTRELQQELRRVGCYQGEINGIWTPASRKAMQAFTDRVNATLPLENPDYILLSLIRAHEGEGCGKACPSGQGLAEDGRCLPTAVLAHAVKKAPGLEIAASKGKDAPTKPAPVIAAWTTTTTAAAPVRSPEMAPPGRMALAGPTIDTPPAAEIAPAAPAVVVRGITKPPSRERRAARPERHVYAQQAYPRRGFVESFLRNRSSQN